MVEKKEVGYRHLIVHQKADELAFQVYLVTKEFPKEELFGLTSQMRRSAISVPANIAEGYTRKGVKDKIHFYNIAQGSLVELEYYFDFSLRLNYIDENKYKELINLKDEVGKLLYVFAKKSE